jgi:hypothetical protein
MTKQQSNLAIILGAVMLALGGWIYLATNAQVKACSNALVSALYSSQCNGYEAWHTIATIVICLSVAAITFAIVFRKEGNEKEGNGA